MPKYVNVQGHGIVGFPDEMGDDEIQAALAKEFPADEPGFFSSLGSGAAEAAGHGTKFLGALAGRFLQAYGSPQNEAPGGAADVGQRIFDYGQAVQERNAPPPEVAAKNVIDNPEILATRQFWGRGLGGLLGGLATGGPVTMGPQQAAETYLETGSVPKAAGVGAVDTALGLLPFSRASRLLNVGLGAGGAAAMPLAEAAIKGQDLTEAAKQAAGAAPFGAVLGYALGRPRVAGASPQGEFEARVRGLGADEPPAAPVQRGLGVPTPEELAGITQRAAEERTLRAMTERRLRTDEGIPPEQAAPEPVQAAERYPLVDAQGRRYRQFDSGGRVEGDESFGRAPGDEGSMYPDRVYPKDQIEAPVDREAEAEALRREIQASQRGALSQWDKDFADRAAPDPFAPPPPKPLEAKLKEPLYRDALTAMRRETGWAEIGGRGVMNPEGVNIGRTSWVPRAEWWPGRPKGLNEGQVKDAIAKALSGEKLNPREAKMIDYMTSYVDESMARAKEEGGGPSSDAIPGFDVQEPYYHGSPHRFDQFKMEAIGTGEGNQTYGHGLYFAQNKGVAESYRPSMIEVQPAIRLDESNSYGFATAVEMLHRAKGDVPMAKTFADARLRQIESTPAQPVDKAGLLHSYRTASALLSDPANFKIKRPVGGLYHVDIPKEATDKMLDRDAYLSKQPAAVKDVARQLLKDQGYLKPHENGPIMLERAWRSYAIERGGAFGNQNNGALLYDELSRKLGGDQRASEYLRSKGIPGLKYFDAGSRRTGSGTRNVVLFDDSLVKVMKVEQPRKAYRGHSIEGPEGKQLGFDFATRPDTTARQVEGSVAAIRDIVRSVDTRAGARVLALGITRDFVKRGATSLVGKVVKNADDVAILSQVYRDPRFETFRVIYTKGDKIVFHSGYTSRVAGAVNLPASLVDDVTGVMQRTGADGYWLQHNHPNGSAEPSTPDQVMTAQMNTRVAGFKGHVIVDNQEFGVIDPDGGTGVRVMKELGGYVTSKNPVIPHALLEAKINSEKQFAALSKTLENREGFTTLVGVSAGGQVKAIAEFPSSALEPVNGQPSATAVARIRRFSRGSGAALVHAVGNTRQLAPYQSAGWFGFVTDVAGGTMGGAHEFYKNFEVLGQGGRRRRTYNVAEERPGYQRDTENEFGGTAPEMPGEPRPERVQVGGGDYSLKKYGNLSNEELGTLTGVMKTLESPVKSQRRGTRTWDATEEAALKLVQDKLGITLENLVNRKKGSTANAEQLEAYGMVLSKATREVTEAAKELGETDSAQAMVRLAAAREKLGVLIAPAMGYKTEAGRSLNILRKMAGEFHTAQRLIDAIGEGGHDVMRDFARRVVRDSGNLDQVIGITRESYRPTIFNKFDEYWINGLLSGPTTHAVNIASNALFQVLELSAEALAAAGSKHVSARELGARIVGMQHGIAHGLKNAKEAYITEEPQLNPVSKLELERRRSIRGKLGRFIRIPGRALMAEDEFFKAMEYHGELGALAMDEAIRTNPKDARAEFDKIMGGIQNRPDLIQQALEAADRATFQDRLGPFMQKVSNMRYGHGPAGWALAKIIPFVRTPTNILKRAVEYTPGGYSMKQVRDAISDGGRNRALAVSRMMVGSTVMLGAMGLSASGKLTGNGPSDPNERALLMRQGWQPYSVKVGDQWVKYNRFDPLSMLMGVAADMYEIGAAGSQGEWDKIGSMAMTSVALNLGDKTFLRGISDFTQAYTDPQRYFDRWGKGLLASVIPNIAAQTARGMDPYMREARSLTDMVLAKIPGAREQLATKLDIAGEPIKQEGDFPGNPLMASQVKDDALADSLLRLGLRKQKPDKTLQLGKFQIELGSKDYESFASYTQQARWRVLTPIVRSPQFQTMMRENPEGAAELLDRQWNAIGKQARQAWIARNPSALVGAKRREAVGSDYVRYTEGQP